MDLDLFKAYHPLNADLLESTFYKGGNYLELKKDINKYLDIYTWPGVYWGVLHYVAIKVQRGDFPRRWFLKLVETFQQTIPCSVCKSHFNDLCKKIRVPDNGLIFAWTFFVHTVANLNSYTNNQPTVYTDKSIRELKTKNNMPTINSMLLRYSNIHGTFPYDEDKCSSYVSFLTDTFLLKTF